MREYEKSSSPIQEADVRRQMRNIQKDFPADSVPREHSDRKASGFRNVREMAWPVQCENHSESTKNRLRLPVRPILGASNGK
jgi:hypothetical protein